MRQWKKRCLGCLLLVGFCLLTGMPSHADLTKALGDANEPSPDQPNNDQPDSAQPGDGPAPDAEPDRVAPVLPNLRRNEAMQLTTIWMKEIRRDQTTLHGYYSHGANAQRTLGNAFEMVGAADHNGHLEAWAGWVYLDWISASNFYTNQAYELRKSQSTIRKRGALTPGQVNYLAQGMQNYRERHAEIADVMAQRVETTARGLHYSELEDHESEEVQDLAWAARQVNSERAAGIHGRIRSYGSDLVFYAVTPDNPMTEYAPQEGLPPHNPVINAGGDGEVSMDELIRMFNKDLKDLKEMRKQIREGKEIDGWRYSALDSRLLSIANEIKERGGTLPEEIPTGRPRHKPETANPNQSDVDKPNGDTPVKLGPPPTAPVKPMALPELGNTPNQKKFKQDVVDSEKELFDHLMTKRKDWDMKSALEWDGKRHALIGKATKAQQSLALAAAGSHSPSELKRLRAISKGLEELATDKKTDKELSKKFHYAKKVLDDYIAVNEALKKAGAGHGPVVKTIAAIKMPNYADAAMKLGGYRAWSDADRARTAMWKHQASMNKKGRDIMHAQQKLLNDRLMRGQKTINESLKQAGRKPGFRVHRDKDYIKTGSPAVKDLLGPSGQNVLVQQAKLRREATKITDKGKSD